MREIIFAALILGAGVQSANAQLVGLCATSPLAAAVCGAVAAALAIGAPQPPPGTPQCVGIVPNDLNGQYEFVGLGHGIEPGSVVTNIAQKVDCSSDVGMQGLSGFLASTGAQSQFSNLPPEGISVPTAQPWSFGGNCGPFLANNISAGVCAEYLSNCGTLFGVQLHASCCGPGVGPDGGPNCFAN